MNVLQRMAAVAAEVPYIQKTANLGRFYALAADDVKKAFQPAFKKHGLVAHCHSCEVVEISTNKCRCNYVLRISNIEKPDDYIDVPSVAYGFNAQHKEAGCAITMAHKYALISAFNSETGEEDPEIMSVEPSSSEMFDSFLQNVEDVELLKSFGNSLKDCRAFTKDQRERLREKIKTAQAEAKLKQDAGREAARKVGTEEQVRMVQEAFPGAEVVGTTTAKVEKSLEKLQGRAGNN